MLTKKENSVIKLYTRKFKSQTFEDTTLIGQTFCYDIWRGSSTHEIWEDGKHLTLGMDKYKRFENETRKYDPW